MIGLASWVLACRFIAVHTLARGRPATAGPWAQKTLHAQQAKGTAVVCAMLQQKNMDIEHAPAYGQTLLYFLPLPLAGAASSCSFPGFTRRFWLRASTLRMAGSRTKSTVSLGAGLKAGACSSLQQTGTLLNGSN